MRDVSVDGEKRARNYLGIKPISTAIGLGLGTFYVYVGVGN